MFEGWPMPGIPEMVAFGVALIAMLVGIRQSKPGIRWRLVGFAALLLIVFMAAVVSHNQPFHL